MFWVTFWLRLGSHFAPGLAQDEPIWHPKALQVAPKGSKKPQGIAMGGTKGPQWGPRGPIGPKPLIFLKFFNGWSQKH